MVLEEMLLDHGVESSCQDEEGFSRRISLEEPTSTSPAGQVNLEAGCFGSRGR